MEQAPGVETHETETGLFAACLESVARGRGRLYYFSVADDGVEAAALYSQVFPASVSADEALEHVTAILPDRVKVTYAGELTRQHAFDELSRRDELPYRTLNRIELDIRQASE